MQINFEINNTAQSPIANKFFQKVAEQTLAELEYDFLSPPAGGPKISVSLAMVAPEEIQKLNKNYRGKDSVTDVLSFAEYENLEGVKKTLAKPPKEGEEEIFLGELVLCYDDIKEYADKEGIRLETELANVVSHGILHLLGFRHGEKMSALQERIKNKF